MSLWVNNNPTANNVWATLTANNEALSNTIEHLSTGLRINGAADDPSGVGLATRLNTNVMALEQAGSNAQDVYNLLNTADGALGNTTSLLQQMYSLAVQGANDTLTASDRTSIQSEMNSLSAQVDQIAHNTTYNNHELLDGGANASSDGGFSAFLFTVDVGASGTTVVTLSIGTMTAASLGVLTTQLSVDTAADASQTMVNITNALNLVSGARGYIGGKMNAINSQIAVLQVQQQNISAAYSSVVDLDMAQASTQLTQQQIVQASSEAMLAQANLLPTNVLSLIGAKITGG